HLISVSTKPAAGQYSARYVRPQRRNADFLRLPKDNSFKAAADAASFHSAVLDCRSHVRPPKLSTTGRLFRRMSSGFCALFNAIMKAK
ncbi:hypothetical protein, partial [Mesorhizobium sp. M7A.F.Ca.ET.027.03.2.1]|uniref:hypothetical protein n=1 Tax=Mesorhizobium sp. M7A.F.Ca.ET.027.03.2.1 TaxID=2496656 RepID=UPI001AECC79B